MCSIHEAELLAFWRASYDAHSIIRSTSNNTTAEQQDDLVGIVIHTNWPRLRTAAASVLMVLQAVPLNEMVAELAR